MAFVVEDGTGKATATSYCSVADADTYHTDHGSPAAWTAATDAQKQAGLMFATTYLDSEFVWLGDITDADQALSWPRSGVTDSEGRDVASDAVPQRVIDATAYMALQHISNALDVSLDRGGDVRRQRVDVVEIEYMDHAKATRYIPWVRKILHGLVKSAPGTVTLKRS